MAKSRNQDWAAAPSTHNSPNACGTRHKLKDQTIDTQYSKLSIGCIWLQTGEIREDLAVGASHHKFSRCDPVVTQEWLGNGIARFKQLGVEHNSFDIIRGLKY